MRKSVFVWLFMLPLLTLSASSLVAQTTSQSTFDQIVAEYYRIHDALANDTTAGIDAAAQKIAKLASPDFAAIKQAATSLQGKKSLEQAREQFFQLSKPIIAELKRNPSAQKSAFAYKCSMANKSWVQGQKEIRNPYYGKSMLKCGEAL